MTSATPDVADERLVGHAPAPSASGQQSSLARGIAWIGLFRWIAQVIAWGTTISVARLLTPRDYGVITLGALLMGFGGLLLENGIARVIILQRITDRRAVRELHGVCLGAGVLLALLLLAFAPFLARQYQDAAVGEVGRALAICLVLGGTSAVPMAMLQQSLDYPRIARIELARSVLQSLTVLTAAFLGAGYWSLPAGIIVAHFVPVILVAIPRWVRPAMPTRSILAGLKYGGYVVAGSLLWYAYSNADFAIIGRVLDPTALGYYQFAWMVASLPGEKITNVIQGAAAPFFGAIGTDHRALNRYLLTVSESLAFVITPVLAGFALVAPVAIPLVFGAKWEPAVLPLQLLVLYALAQNLMVLLNLVLSVSGFARVNTLIACGLVMVLPPLFFVAARASGIVAVAAVWAIAQPLLLAIPTLVARARLGLSLRAYLGMLRGPLAASLVMTAAVWWAGSMTEGLIPVHRLVVMIACGALVYPAVCLLFFRARLLQLRQFWRGAPAVDGA